MTLAIYPGSFDPITLGHVDVARRAARLLDRLIVAIYAGGDKPGGLFPLEERLALAQEALIRRRGRTSPLTASPA